MKKFKKLQERKPMAKEEVKTTVKDSTPIKTDSELRIELMERRIEEQMSQLNSFAAKLDERQDKIAQWEMAIANKVKAKKSLRSSGPIEMCVGRFRNFNERGRSLEFYFQEDHYKLSDNTEYVLPMNVAEHLNNIKKKIYLQDSNGFAQPQDEYDNLYFVQIMDVFFKDSDTKEYYKISDVNGKKVKVPFDVTIKNPLQQVKAG